MALPRETATGTACELHTFTLRKHQTQSEHMKVQMVSSKHTITGHFLRWGAKNCPNGCTWIVTQRDTLSGCEKQFTLKEVGRQTTISVTDVTHASREHLVTNTHHVNHRVIHRSCHLVPGRHITRSVKGHRETQLGAIEFGKE